MRKLFPYLLSFLAVVAAAVFFFYSDPGLSLRVGNAEPVEDAAPEPDTPRTFTGRVVMPDVENILVLENSADRDMEKIATYLLGRAAGLHWLARPYFRAHRGSDDVIVGVRMTIDSLGSIACDEIAYSNAEDESLKEALQGHIEHYWRYRKSESGKTELWVPIRFRAVY